VHCPFCGEEMRSGKIKVRALRHFEAAVDWEPDEPASSRRWWKNLIFDMQAGHTRQVLTPGNFGRGWRAASYCDGCGAVLAHPRDEVTTLAD
jgi:hypothetical protein